MSFLLLWSFVCVLSAHQSSNLAVPSFPQMPSMVQMPSLPSLAQTWQCQVWYGIAKFDIHGILLIGIPTFATLKKASSAADRFDVREVVGIRFRSS